MMGIAEPLHAPDGKKRGGADPATLGGPLVMQVVISKIMKISISNPLVRDAIYLAYKGECFYTGRPVARDQMEIDHLIPVSKNGMDCFENYVLTFKNLNIGKRNKIDSRRIERMQT